MTQDDLIRAAATAAIGALTKSAAEPLLATGQKVWTWLKGKLTGTDASLAEAVEAEPAKPSTPERITALLKDLLYDNPTGIEELKKLLGGDAQVQAINQTATVTGNKNQVFQVAGDGNMITHAGVSVGQAPSRPWPKVGR